MLALVPALVAGGGLVWWHEILGQAPPAWLPQVFHGLLAVCGVFYVGAWLVRLLARRSWSSARKRCPTWTAPRC
ncbi:hypothetical protein D3C71_1997710 [compost metagenome]